MDILPFLDFEKLASLPAKWVCGYSDVTTLTFPLTIISDIATIRGCMDTLCKLLGTRFAPIEAFLNKYKHDGIMIGRPDGYEAKRGFTLIDALKQGLGALNAPVLYDTDIGHMPPQIQIVNGAMGRVEFADGKATVWQSLKE